MRAFIVFIGTLALTATAMARDLPGSPAVGHDMAQRECAVCHAVERDEEPEVNGGIPPFQQVARDPAVTETALRVFLTTSHPTMPNFIMKPHEIDDIVAYILSLKD